MRRLFPVGLRGPKHRAGADEKMMRTTARRAGYAPLPVQTSESADDPAMRRVASRGIRKLGQVISLGTVILLGACQTDGPRGQGPVAQGRPDPLADALIVSVPAGVEKAPVVMLLEGNGGSNRMHPTWGPFFLSRGIAVVQIQSAKARGRRNWEGTGCGLQYAGDPRAALESLRSRPEVDTTRFAVMGFSRGGTEALGGGREFIGALAQPAAVFAFYPGCSGVCETDWKRRAPQVPVHIFYGGSDGWGSHKGTRSSCRSLAGESIAYHEYPNAQHGFDAPWEGQFRAGGDSFRFGPDPVATEAAQKVVAEVLSRAWGDPK